MTQSNNEIIALRYLEGMNRGNAATVLDIFNDEARIWIAGKSMVKAEFAGMLELVKTLFVKGPEMRCKSIFASGDKVALEMAVSGDSKKGRRYENSYCLIF